MATLAGAAGALRDFLFEPGSAGDAEPAASSNRPARRSPPLVLVTEAPGARGATLAAAAAATLAARGSGPGLLVSLTCEARPPAPTLLASPEARVLAADLHRRDPRLRGALVRGRVCFLPLDDGGPSLELTGDLVRSGAAAGSIVVYVPAPLWSVVVDGLGDGATALLGAELPRQRAVAALWVGAARTAGMRARVGPGHLDRLAARRARSGLEPGGAGGRRLARLLRGVGGQALPMVLGAALVLVLATAILVAWVGAATGKGRVQRGADLIALSAARSMRDDFDRLFVPPEEPLHLEKGEYLDRARAAGLEAASANGVALDRVAIDFPDGDSFAPVRVSSRVRAELVPDVPGGGDRRAAPARFTVEAEATIAPGGAGAAALPDHASGGGYSGPLAQRQGQSMRPDVAAAFDRMAAAAARAGLRLGVASGYRSNAEQAVLWARHPDPRWVAPPGHSLHRCGTELDLGPKAAYGWLERNAGRFGFVKRYSWEPWHFGYVHGPAPCAGGGDDQIAGAGGDGGSAGRAALPDFVPAAYRSAIERASARWNVPAALLAAQLMAESGFNPFARSRAGAEGIAQFMPGTARTYGLDHPFDPDQAIGAQAHLMSDLLREFGSAALALAAYNAGAGAVRRYGGIPPFAETRAYVARILALAGGAGWALGAPALEVRLVA